MNLNMPAFLILYGPAASALSADLRESLHDHLSDWGRSPAVIWRIDPAPGTDPEDGVLDLKWNDMTADQYIGTLFCKKYQAMMDRQIEGKVLMNACYACIITVGGESPSEALAQIRIQASEMLTKMNIQLRSHLIWLIEDDVLKTGSNYRLIANDLKKGTDEIGGFDRITVLSGHQSDGANTFATRRQRIDALVPCILNAVNVNRLDGAKYQTLAYRKLNCTSAEMRRLLDHRTVEALMDWQAAAVDNQVLWSLFSSSDLPLNQWSDNDAATMGHELAKALLNSLPGIADFLTVEDPSRLGNGYDLVDGFSRANDQALMKRFSGDGWEAQRMSETQAKLRRCLNLRTVLEFIRPQGNFYNKLSAVTETAAAEGRANNYQNLWDNGRSFFRQKSADQKHFESMARVYLSGLSYRILSERLKRILRSLDEVQLFVKDLLSASESALSPYRLSPETEMLYHAFAENYDRAISDGINDFQTADAVVIGETQVFFPSNGSELTALWRSFHKRLAHRFLEINPNLNRGFSSAYVLGKTDRQVEQDISNKLNNCHWQLSGGTISENDVSTYYVSSVIAQLFPANLLGNEPVCEIPGDLVEYVRFGNVAEQTKQLTDLFPFRNGERLNACEDALQVLKAETLAASVREKGKETQTSEKNASGQEENLWHIRLDSSGSEFMLYWAWPERHNSDAMIRIDHQDGTHTTVPCNIDLYKSQMGRSIHPDRLGIGRNRISIYHDQEMQSIEVMGRRVKVTYSIEELRHRKHLIFNGERIDLQAFALRYQIPDASMADRLRLMTYGIRDIPILTPLPDAVSVIDGEYLLRFYSASASVILTCDQESEEMIEISKVE